MVKISDQTAHFVQSGLNSLPNNKFLAWSKLKAFADDKIYVTEKLKFLLGTVENVTGNRENTGYQHFLLFPHSQLSRTWKNRCRPILPVLFYIEL